jgi:hypothetical protein
MTQPQAANGELPRGAAMPAQPLYPTDRYVTLPVKPPAIAALIEMGFLIDADRNSNAAFLKALGDMFMAAYAAGSTSAPTPPRTLARCRRSDEHAPPKLSIRSSAASNRRLPMPAATTAGWVAAWGRITQLVAPPGGLHCNCLDRNCVTRLIASARASWFEPTISKWPSGEGVFRFVTVTGRLGASNR